EVLKIIIEIVINLVGAEIFCVYVHDEKTGMLEAVASEGEEVHLRDYLRVLRKYRLTILLFVLVTVLTVAVASLRMPKTYEAVVRLAIDRESPTDLVKNTAPADPWSFQDYLRTQIRVLQSDTLAVLTLRSLRLDREPEFAGQPEANEGGEALPEEKELKPADESRLIGSFLGGLRVVPVPSSWLVEIRYYSTNPELAARIANAHANNFIEHNFRTRYEATTKASDWLSDQLRELRGRVEGTEKQLRDYERRYNLVSIDERQNVLTQRLSDLNHQLSLAEAERVAKESEYRQAASGERGDLLQDALVDRLEERLAELRTEHAENRTRFGSQHPRMQRLEEQIADVEAQVAGERRVILARLQADYQAAGRRETMVRELVERQKGEVNQLNQHMVQYNILKREARANKELYDGLLRQLSEAGVVAGLRSSNIRIVDPARVPMAPYKPNVALNVMLALFLSVPVGIALAFFREYLDNTIKTPDEVERYSRLPTLAMVPLSEGPRPLRRLRSQALDPKRAQSVALVASRHPQSSIAEAYRTLRTSVLLSFADEPPRALLVTSGQPLEGKTTTAVNLAITLAQRGDRVVLVDADLRKPAVHHFLPHRSRNGHQGLSLYLAGSQEISDAVMPTTIPNLSVLPAGPLPPNPAELLSSNRMKDLLATLARHYEHIVVDAPPLLGITDATVLSVLVDGVIVVVRSGQTTREMLRHAHQMLQSVGARALGVVLNGIAVDSVDYYYYYYKHYGRDVHHRRAS
ncbi:MAG: GumC family protein, partial [Terriglobia bacterium]